MSAPTITLLTDDGDRRRFRIEGGTLSNGWAARPGNVAWCEVTIYRTHQNPEHPALSSYGGEVWPSAWPELFECVKGSVQTGPLTFLTPAGVEAFEKATPKAGVARRW